jgi:hypothetical protein
MLHVFQSVESTTIEVVDWQVLNFALQIVALVSQWTSSIAGSDWLEDRTTKNTACIAGINGLDHVEVFLVVFGLRFSLEHFNALLCMLILWFHFGSAATHIVCWNKLIVNE